VKARTTRINTGNAHYHRMQNVTRTNRSDSAIVAGVRVTATLNAIRVNTRRRSLGRASYRIPVAAIIVHIFQIKGVNVPGEVPIVERYN
jgi:hypothetical protein